MSAPRKIWADKASMGWVEAYPGQQMNPCEEIYHHDDVVRELARAGSNMHAFVDLYGDEAMRGAAAEWRAALAKIAQEDQR